MKDEIKEILDRLDAEEFELPEYSSPISWVEMFEIRDYITNLQEENEKFKEYARSYLKSKIDRKNKELELIKTKFIEEHNQCYDYKSRNEKAVDYIKNISERAYKDDYGTCFSTYDLLNILLGFDK